MKEPDYHLGIDPGTKNLGICLLDSNNKFVSGKVFDAMPEGTGIVPCIDNLYSCLYEVCRDKNIATLGIERFVSYKGMLTSNTENILMVIGALVNICQTKLNLITPPTITLYRAIEWKPSLCKHLVKTQGFSNPSTSFDKRYSKAAAEAITGEKFKNDHLADAICVAFVASKLTKQK